MTLALAAIVLDEANYLPRWWHALQGVLYAFEEIVVVDGGSSDGTVELLKQYEQETDGKLRVVTHPFGGHFARQRNIAVGHTATDWILFLDADEFLSAPLADGLREIIGRAEADGVDCVGIPRLNFHDDRLQTSAGYRGLDYQYRLHRRDVYWTNPVHEVVEGYARRVELDIREGRFILHMKSQERFEERNRLYERLGRE